MSATANFDDLEKRSLQQTHKALSSSITSTNTKKKSNYGSIRNETQHTAKAFIVNYKHKIVPGETLQGISLKYVVPVSSRSHKNGCLFYEIK